jgi:hypothetical protein
MSAIKESDWKLFRRFHPIALDRFCERILKDSNTIVSAGSKNHYERYLELYKLVRAKDEDLGRMFNDFRRSTALIQLRLICSFSLLTDEEMAQFSPEAQVWITS